MSAQQSQSDQQLQQQQSQPVQQSQTLQSQQQQPQQQIENQTSQDAQQTFMQINNWDPSRQVQVIPAGLPNTGYMPYNAQGQVMMPNIATFAQPNGQLVLSQAGSKQFQPSGQVTATPQTVFIAQGNKFVQATPGTFQGFNQLSMTPSGQTFVLASGNIPNIIQQQAGNPVPALNSQDPQKDLQPVVVQQWQAQHMPQQMWSSPQSTMFAQAPNNITYVNRASCNQQGDIFTATGVVQNNQNLIAQVVNTQNAVKRPIEQNAAVRPVIGRNLLPANQTVRPVVATSQATSVQNVFLFKTGTQQVKARPKTSFVPRTPTMVQQKSDQMVSQIVSQTQQIPQTSIVNTQPLVTALPQHMLQQQVMIRNATPQQQTLTTGTEMLNLQHTIASIPQQQIIAQPSIVSNQAVPQQPVQQDSSQNVVLSTSSSQGLEITGTTSMQSLTSTSADDKTSTKALAMVKPNQMIPYIISGNVTKELDGQNESVEDKLNGSPNVSGSDSKMASPLNKSPSRKRRVNGQEVPNESASNHSTCVNQGLPRVTLPENLAKKDPSSWTIQDVANFVRTLPLCAELAEKFENEEIDGEALFMLEPEHLMFAMEVKLGPALKIIEHIKSIRSDSSTDSSSTLDFQQPSAEKMALDN